MSGQRPDGALAALSREIAAAVERAGAWVVAVHARHNAPSSGVVWRPGAVVTAAHTVKRYEEITVALPDGRAVPAELAGRDPGTDLAVLRLGEETAPAAAETGELEPAGAGALVLAVGRGGAGVHASLGVVASAGGPWRTWRGGQIDRFLGLGLGPYPGFSGSALVTAEGRVAGVNTAGLVRGAGVAVPASTVDRVVEEILARGRVARGFLGVAMQPVRLPGAMLAALGLSGGAGVMVLHVEPGGPADRGGLLIGDIIVKLDDVRVEDTDDVQAMLGGERVGAPLRVAVVRGGAAAEATVTVGEWPRARRS